MIDTTHAGDSVGVPTTTSARASLWLDGAPVTDYPALTGRGVADVCVIGGGIAGMTAALLLKRDGARVIVLEAARVGTGVTGCTTAKVSALQATVYTTVRERHGTAGARAYAQASLRGVDTVARLVAEEALDCELERADAVTFSLTPEEAPSVLTELAAARTAGLPVERGSVDLPVPVHEAVRLPGQLALQPTRYVQGLAAAVDGDGSAVHEASRVIQVREGSPCTVVCARGEVRARDVVIATHYPILDRGLFFPRLRAQRSYCIACRLGSGDPPAELTISAGSDSRSIRGYRDLLIIGGEGHPAGSGEATPQRFLALEQFAREHWDVAEVTHRWSAHDPVPYDHLPMIGGYRPGSTHLHVATGWMKWGMSSASFAAELISDRIAGRVNELAATFSPQRLSPGSVREVAELGASFSRDLIADRLRPPDARASSEIPPGQARVLRDKLGRKGVYRDPGGSLHAVSLRCTHLGCLLRFNAAEASWDCSCHGSRFDVDGGVLEGPAVHALDRRDP